VYPAPDKRMASSSGSGGDGRAVIEHRLASWPVSPSVPASVVEVLRVARLLYIRSLDVYEFSLVAVTWALMALEASLRLVAPPDTQAHQKGLIDLAAARGLLTAEEAESLHQARKLRNLIVHGHLLPSFNPLAAENMLQAVHEAICDLHDRDVGGP
jgi:hypothetical protein